MPQARIRPTREQTRARVIEAAATVFEERGIGGTSVEKIVSAAGLTRGAFYSNFDSKDDLIMAILADHVAQTVRRNLELLAHHRDPADFLAAVGAVDRSQQDPLGRSPLLHIELILHAARAAERRPELAQRLHDRRALIVEVIRGTNLADRLEERDGEPLAAMLLAMEDGFRLHRLIDPDTTPADSFMQALATLQRIAG